MTLTPFHDERWSHGSRPGGSDTSGGRRPSAQRPRRMDRLATLPLFFPLDGRRAVVIGGSEAAAWKAELLSAAGASVSVLSPDPCEDMEALAADPPGGRGAPRAARRGRRRTSTARPSSWAPPRTRRRRRPSSPRPRRWACPSTSSTSRPSAPSSSAPSSTARRWSSASPPTARRRCFGQAIRSRIEALLPAGFARWAEAAKAWRAELAGLEPRQPPCAAASGRPSPPWPCAPPTAHRSASTGTPCCARPHRSAEAECLGHAGPRDPGRRRPRRPGAADAQGGARPALGRRDPVRRPGGARGAGFRPPRGQAPAGRQDRPPPLLQAGRHQRPDGRASPAPASAWCGSRPAIP